MKRFVLEVGGQSLTFSVGDIEAMRAALDEAVEHPEQPASHAGASGQVSVTMYDGRPGGVRWWRREGLGGPRTLADQDTPLTDGQGNELTDV